MIGSYYYVGNIFIAEFTSNLLVIDLLTLLDCFENTSQFPN